MSGRRVLHLIAQLGAGGTERQLLHLIRRTERGRYEPEVIAFTEGGSLEQEFRSACPVTILPKRPWTEARVLARLSRAIRERGPAILHTWLYPANWRGALAARHSGRPILIGAVRNLSTWMGPASRAIERAATRAADAVVVNAPAVARFMIEEVGADGGKIRVIPNGVDLEAFRPARAGDPDMRAPFATTGQRLVGCVMSLTRKKNPRVLLEAAARVLDREPSTRFAIAGEGPMREELAELARGPALSGRVALAGLRRDVPDFLRALDLLVLPSDREGLPNVVLEAMATGLPVVATAVGGSPDIVLDGRTGRIVPPGDPVALSEAILDVLRDPGRARAWGEEGLRLARSEYGLDRMVERTLALYDELLARRAVSRREEGPAKGRDRGAMAG